MSNHPPCNDIMEMKAFYSILKQELADIKQAQKDEVQKSDIDRNMLIRVVANQENISNNVMTGFKSGRDKMDVLANDIRELQNTVTKAEGSIGATRWIGATVVTGIGLILAWIGLQK